MSSHPDHFKRLAFELSELLAYFVAGGLVAGFLGILHDEITWLISREYFTGYQFYQFSYADFDLPYRDFVAEIGFLSAWWMGAAAAFILAAVAMWRWGRVRSGSMIRAGVIIGASSLTGGILGGILGYLHRSHPDYGDWQRYALYYRIHDLPAFMNAGYIHNGSYLGAIAGFILALIIVARRR